MKIFIASSTLVLKYTQSLRNNKIYFICPRSSFSPIPTSRRCSILVKGPVRSLTSGTPATILNCKHVIAPSHCSHGALGNGVLTIDIMSIQDTIFFFFFQFWDCTTDVILITSYNIMTCKQTTVVISRASVARETPKRRTIIIRTGSQACTENYHKHKVLGQASM